MSFGEKTEAPTPRRRRQAREKGEVAKSQELIGALILLGTLMTLKSLAPWLGKALEGFTVDTLQRLQTPRLGVLELAAVGRSTMAALAMLAGPILAVAGLTAVVAGVGQVGLLFTLKPVQPKGERLSPAKGFQRMFSRNSAMELAKGVAKIGLVTYVAIHFLHRNQETIYGLTRLDGRSGVGIIGGLVIEMAIRMALAFLIVAIIDYSFQRYQSERNLKMTVQEVKEDQKQTEGDPHLRSHIRARQREIGANRMIADVADATAVITNPTHLAIALRYEAGKEDAPRCLAKGKGLLAKRIREVAREHDVPVLENKPLARSLYGLVRVGQVIPEALYQAVAEVLALVWQAGAGRQRR